MIQKAAVLPLRPQVWGGSCRRSPPSLGDTGIQLLLTCSSSFQLCPALCLYSTDTDFKYMYFLSPRELIFKLLAALGV